MTEPVVSVIIPVFNTQPWLAPCIESIKRQNFEDLEIICIDDGSTDGSLAALNELAGADDRIIVKTQENHGPGYTRNRAIDMASGKYILFLDSDDMLADGFIDQLVRTAETDDTDMICFDLVPFYESNELGKKLTELSRHHRFDYPGITDGRELFAQMQKNDDYFSEGCLGFFRKSWLDEKRIRFPEGIFMEDALFTFLCFFFSRNCRYLNVPGYLRRLREGSTVTKKLSLIHVLGYYRTAGIMEALCYENQESLEDYPEFFAYILKRRVSAYYIYRNNRDAIRSQARTNYEKMMLDDLDNYGSRAELDAVYNSVSWKLGNLMVRPFHWLKK